MPDILKMSAFEACLHQQFTCDVEATSLALELIEVVALPPKESEEVRRKPFSLLFLGPAEPILVQQTVQLKNNQLGELLIFLVPLGPKGEAMQYEAVFT